MAGYIASAGFPMPGLFAWLAAIFETALVLAFFTGARFREAALLAGIPSSSSPSLFRPAHWEGNQAEFGFFVDHFTFLAGPLFGRRLRAGALGDAPLASRPR